MPTKKRRLIITLPPELDAALVRFSKVTGQPQSSFVLSCLMENIESLNLITDAVEQAKAGNISQSEALIAQALGSTILKLHGSSESEE
jgi:predicted DNA-binding protein